jgi:hypothetical protein
MIAEWRKGCSVSQGRIKGDQHPATCVGCTRALVEAIESRLRQDAAWMPPEHKEEAC